jgi:hypothetical protein
VIARGIREFVQRDWSSVRAAKDAYWAERIARLGAGEALRVGDDLRRQMLRSDPGWPHAHERAADTETHVRVAALLRRADRTRQS